MPDYQSTTTPANAASVTELVLSSNSPEQIPLLMPMLAYMSNSDESRWITWIAPAKITKALLQHYGIDTNKIRVIHPKAPEDTLWLTWEALNSGSSQTVISSPQQLSDKHIRHLENAAQTGNTHCLLLRQR